MATHFFSRQISVRHPIIQAPMAGSIINPDFVAQVSNFGMLGSIPSGYLSLEQLENFIIEVKNRTSHPFQVNMFVDYCDHHQLNIPKPQELLVIEKKLGIYESDYCTMPQTPAVSDIVALAIEYKVPIVSTIFGILEVHDLKKLQDNDVFLMVTVNCVEEAEIAISQLNVNAIIFQNAHAGGHKGGFLDKPYSTAKSMMRLKEKHPHMYFIKSGGIVNKRDIQEALHRGYDGVQIGTGFLMTKESTATELYKNMLLETTREDQIVTTENITGKKARGVRNSLTELEMEERLPYPLLHYATKKIRDFAKKNDRAEYQSFWTGTGVVNIGSVMSLNDYMTSLV